MALKKFSSEISSVTAAMLQNASLKLQPERSDVQLRNDELEARNQELTGQVAALQQALTELQPAVEAAQRIPELTALLKDKDQAIELLKQHCLKMKQIAEETSRSAAALQSQLNAGNAEIKLLKSQLEAVRVRAAAPAAPSASAAPKAAPKPVEMTAAAGTGRRKKKVAGVDQTAFMKRLFLFHKLFREMGTPLLAPADFCRLADLAKGFDTEMCRALVKYIREMVKFHSPEYVSTVMSECVCDVQSAFDNKYGKYSKKKLFR